MSEPLSRVLYPFEIARRPSIEPEVRRAILARWSASPPSDQVPDRRRVAARSEQSTRGSG